GRGRALVARWAGRAGRRPRVGGEVGGAPVQDGPDPGAVQPVDEVAQAALVAEGAVGGVVARDVVAPGTTVGVLHDRHGLHVGETQGGDVVDELVGELLVAQTLLPAAQVDQIGRAAW